MSLYKMLNPFGYDNLNILPPYCSHFVSCCVVTKSGVHINGEIWYKRINFPSHLHGATAWSQPLYLTAVS